MPLLLAVEDPSVAGARSGDPIAWADLYERFHPVLHRYLEVMSPADAADMDVFWERAARALSGQPEGVNPLVWLFRSARDGQLLQPSPESSDDPTIQAIRRLRPLEMDVVSLRVIGGLNDDDVAAVIGRSADSVCTAARRGVATLLEETGR